MRRACVVVVAVVALAPLLGGCPASYGFAGEVVTKRDPAARVELVAVSNNRIASDALVPVAGARVTCDGCDDRPIEVDARGHFAVSRGTSYASPKSIVLHLSANGYEPVDLEIPRSGMGSEAGFPTLVVVLKRRPP